MIYLIILSFGLGAFIIAFIYQLIATSKINIFLKFFSVLFFTLSLITVAFLREKHISRDTAASKTIAPRLAPINEEVEALKPIIKGGGLENELKPLIKAEAGTYAIGVKNLKTGEEYYLNENKQFETASLYKMWVMAVVYQKIGQGKLSLTQTLSDDVTNLNSAFKIGSDSAELTEGTITDTVSGALNKMITISDNYSAYLLSANVRFSTISQFLTTNNLMHSKIGTQAITNTIDMVSFFQKLYNKQLVSAAASNQMLESLKKQALNDRIPRYLPEGIDVAHKTGELDGTKHDAGIVYSPKGDYIIVLMSNTNDPAHATQVEANISKKVWDYFNR